MPDERRRCRRSGFVDVKITRPCMRTLGHGGECAGIYRGERVPLLREEPKE